MPAQLLLRPTIALQPSAFIDRRTDTMTTSRRQIPNPVNTKETQPPSRGKHIPPVAQLTRTICMAEVHHPSTPLTVPPGSKVILPPSLLVIPPNREKTMASAICRQFVALVGAATIAPPRKRARFAMRSVRQVYGSSVRQTRAGNNHCKILSETG